MPTFVPNTDFVLLANEGRGVSYLDSSEDFGIIIFLATSLPSPLFNGYPNVELAYPNTFYFISAPYFDESTLALAGLA